MQFYFRFVERPGESHLVLDGKKIVQNARPSTGSTRLDGSTKWLKVTGNFACASGGAEACREESAAEVSSTQTLQLSRFRDKPKSHPAAHVPGLHCCRPSCYTACPPCLTRGVSELTVDGPRVSWLQHSLLCG